MVSFACDYAKNVDTKLNKNQDPNEGRQLNGLLLNTLYVEAVSYTHLTLPTIVEWCRSRWSPYH